MDRMVAQLHLEDMRLKATAFAFGTADVEIAQKLHFDFLETSSTAALATAAAGVERERARGQALRHRFRLGGKELTHPVVDPEIKNRSRTRSARKRRLVDHHDLADSMRAGNAL